jgi:nucleoside-diphosphate-sugar epimerase
MNALVLGAGGFIGNHLAMRLKQEGYVVYGVDLKLPEFNPTPCDKFFIGDLRDYAFCKSSFSIPFDEVYQLAADMGGAGYLFSGDNDFNVMHNSALINLNVSQIAIEVGVPKLFFSSSACIYPKYNQQDETHPLCTESSAYPADPDSEYGWEKLFSERIYISANRNYNLNIRIARFHNVYGANGSYNNGKEKVPAALCRKVALAEKKGEIEIWGTGHQTRSFLYIEDCLDGIRKLMNSDFKEPINIGSEELISINDFAKLIISISGKQLAIKNISGPVGVMGRRSDNTLAKEILNWEPKVSLEKGLEVTYQWINQEIEQSNKIVSI